MDSVEFEDSYWAKRITETEGEWAGWTRHPGGDPFEDLDGPFYHPSDQGYEAKHQTRLEARREPDSDQ